MFKNRSVRFETPKDAGGSSSGTLGEGSVPEGTLPPGATDAGLEKQQYEEKLRQREEDINRLKSSLQSQMAQQKKQWDQERSQLLDDLRKAQMASLDDDERVEFQKNLELEQAREMRQQLQKREQELQEMQAAQSYREYFMAQGVPADKLVTDQGLDALVNSGWAGIQEMISSMRTKLEQLEKQPPATPPDSSAAGETPPRTPISAGSSPAGSGPTWTDLIAKYGSQEQVYQLVESGVLPPTIIPTE